MDSNTEIPSNLSTEDLLKLFNTIQTSVDATISSSAPLATKVKNNDDSLDFTNGLSLLLLRPQMLLSSLQNLIILLSLRLIDPSLPFPTSDEIQSTISLSTPFTAPRSHKDIAKGSVGSMMSELSGELMLGQEVMDKVRGMESKLEYQIKKLIGLAESSEKKVTQDDVEEDPLSFRPNPSAIVSSREPTTSSSSTKPSKYAAASDEEDGSSSQIYRPPRVAAVPYLENGTSRSERKERQRQAPALLSEFAASIDSAPILESTSGLSVRPVSNKATNSVSAKRAEELKRIQEFEESNMTRLVTSKKEAKRRRDDEAALAMGFGIGSGRGRRGRNGLDAELEGVLGDRGSKGVWDGVGKLGHRGDTLQRGKKRLNGGLGGEGKRSGESGRFERDMKRRKN
ncbi:U3 small nucleolar ribonucleoprotein LCP5 [Kwoniella mangroviensis CBS 10435]|uniref:U3 small nucleolar ribonucleoprotein LCP5 n=1 Tax=Kwoniella mangroviensis CBS 10435 TaxID=1331196 RepID=A0A1B9IW74_9TREE|nr:U3 small nucleolar ribonucleoprotein LCP5 [Kwoniella mangroviensis CBS 10435]